MAFRLRSIHYVVKWIIAVFILYPPHVTSQSQHTTFTSVAPEELSDSFVRCFLKDSKGYMWFGTNEGLVRYDGIKTYWYVHDPTDNKTIANNSINVIIEDANQKLWIGTAQGLNSYDRETDSFTNVDSISGNKNN